MRTFSLTTLCLLLFFLTSAYGHGHGGRRPEDRPCISDQNANKLLNSFVSLLEKISVPLAEQILTPDFTQKSVSLNQIFGLEFNATTSPNRTSFIQSQQLQQSMNPGGGGAVNETFTILDSIHDCKRIWFHWTDNKTPIPFTGFDEMFLAHDAKAGWQIKQDLSEFNSAAVAVDAGAANGSAGAA